nr:ankyrin repeat [Pandoravirus massiliensis]
MSDPIIKKAIKNGDTKEAMTLSPATVSTPNDITCLPLPVLRGILNALDRDIDFGACVAAHSCFRNAAHDEGLWDARRLSAWMRQGAVRLAARGDTGALQALADNGIPLCRAHLVAAAADGHLDTVTWLYARKRIDDTRSEPDGDATALDVAAANGHMDVVRFLHDKDDGTQRHGQVATVAAMDGAAERGHLHVVEFLDKHRSEGCTERAMDWAAFYGHVSIVALLHERRSEGCTKWAMDAAATNGHLRVVTYLDQHRNEGCTTAAMDGAAAEGHLDVFAYLYQHRSEGCTENALLDAQAGGHWDIVDFIEKHRIKPKTPARRARRGALAP